MKKLLKIVIGIAVAIAVAVSVVFYFTSDMTKTAENFFAAIKEKDYTTAYQYLSEDFRLSTPQTEFVSFFEKGALLQFKEASWGNRSISGGRGELDGSITTENGGVVPIKLSFVKENGRWLIYSIHKPQAGIAGGESGRLPGESVQVALARESMRKFALSVNAKDFSEFHQYISRLWQRQITVDGLNEVFKTFWENNINLLPLENYSPVFDGDPSMNEDGVLVMRGYYPTQPSKVLFEFKYIYEGVSWKLIGTNVNVVPAG